MTHPKDEAERMEFERAFIREWGLPTDKHVPDDYEEMKNNAWNWFQAGRASVKSPDRKPKIRGHYEPYERIHGIKLRWSCEACEEIQSEQIQESGEK